MSSDGTNYAVVKTVNSNIITVDIDYNYQPGISYSFGTRAKTNNNYSSYSNIVVGGIKSLAPVLLSPKTGLTDQSTNINTELEYK